MCIIFLACLQCHQRYVDGNKCKNHDEVGNKICYEYNECDSDEHSTYNITLYIWLHSFL